ncbi:Uncharacterised protein [Neisseria meningitidis]|nr:Uncharacterised protein [Neisseria meningitidis]CWT80417.1 Uncharacterised protein [Neisseria meningitidis]
MVEVARSLPGGAQGNLYTYAGAGLFVVLFGMVLNTFDVQTAFYIGINAAGSGCSPFESGITFACQFDFFSLEGRVIVCLGKIMVFTFAATHFAISINTGLRAYGDAYTH